MTDKSLSATFEAVRKIQDSYNGLNKIFETQKKIRDSLKPVTEVTLTIRKLHESIKPFIDLNQKILKQHSELNRVIQINMKQHTLFKEKFEIIKQCENLYNSSLMTSSNKTIDEFDDSTITIYTNTNETFSINPRIIFVISMFFIIISNRTLLNNLLNSLEYLASFATSHVIFNTLIKEIREVDQKFIAINESNYHTD